MPDSTLLLLIKRILFELASSFSLVAEILRRGKRDNETLIAISICLSVALICKLSSFPVCVFCSWSGRMKRLATFDLLVRFDSLKETLSVEFSLDLSTEGWLIAYSSELLVQLQKISLFWAVRVFDSCLVNVLRVFGFFLLRLHVFLRNWRRLFVFFAAMTSVSVDWGAQYFFFGTFQLIFCVLAELSVSFDKE